MRILCSGDHHWNSRGIRFEECKRVHRWMVDYARDNAIDLFVSTGDVFDLANSTTEERDAVSDWLIAMAEVCDVLVVDGNHGSSADVELMRKLESRHRIVIETGAAVHRFGVGSTKLAVACVAWPDRANLVRVAGGEAAVADELASVALQNVFRGLEQLIAPHEPSMLAGHFMVDGSLTSTGQPLIGSEMHVSLSELALVGADITVMGHVHKAQQWTYGSADYLYTGSPYRTNYGESEEKSVVLVEWPDVDAAPVWTRVPTPASPMLHILSNWVDDHDGARLGFYPYPTPDVTGAYVRLRCVVPADERASAVAACSEWRSKALAEGAADVKVEIEALPTGTARAPEVSRATTLADKLDAYWGARGTQPDAARAARLITLANDLETASAL